MVSGLLYSVPGLRNRCPIVSIVRLEAAEAFIIRIGQPLKGLPLKVVYKSV